MKQIGWKLNIHQGRVVDNNTKINIYFIPNTFLGKMSVTTKILKKIRILLE